MIRRIMKRFGYVPVRPPAHLVLFVRGKETLNVPVDEVERLSDEDHPILIRNQGKPFMAIRVRRSQPSSNLVAMPQPESPEVA